MAIDTIRQRAVENREKKHRADDKLCEIELELEQVESVAHQIEDWRISDALNDVRDRLASEHEESIRTQEEIEQERDDIVHEATDEWQKYHTAREKLAALSGKRYAKSVERPASMVAEKKLDLEDILRLLGAIPETPGISNIGDATAEGCLDKQLKNLDISTCVRDDNGQPFMTADRKLLPNISYRRNGFLYKTDGKGRIVSYEGNPIHVEDAVRKLAEQGAVGKQFQIPGDVGFHLIAVSLSGVPGLENMIAGRKPINISDYKSAECTIKSALDRNKDVWMRGEIRYEDPDTDRATGLILRYGYEDQTWELKIDNVRGSMMLANELRENIPPSEWNDKIANEIKYRYKQGHTLSLTSIHSKIDAVGNVVEITVRMLDEDMYDKHIPGSPNRSYRIRRTIPLN